MDNIHFERLLCTTMKIHDRLDKLSKFSGQEEVIKTTKEEWFKRIKYINKKVSLLEETVALPLIKMLDERLAELEKEKKVKSTFE